MTALLIYIGKVALLLVAFYLFYKLLLSRETFHRLGRLVLMGAFVLSALLPFCIITVHRTEMIPAGESALVAHVSEFEMPADGMRNLNMATTGSEASDLTAQAATPKTPWWQWALLGLYVAGVIVTLSRTAYSALQVSRLIRSGEQHYDADGTPIIVVDHDLAPFSWMQWIVLSRNDYEEASPFILAHEKAHLAFGHSKEVLLAEIFCDLQWFNPAAWLLKRELRAIHEYEADDAVLSHGADVKAYQYSLVKKAVGASGYSITNSFHHSILKNRITMMSKSRSPKVRALRGLYLLPLALVFLAANAHTVTDYKVSDNSVTTDKQVSLVVPKSSAPVEKRTEHAYFKIIKGDAVADTLFLYLRTFAPEEIDGLYNYSPVWEKDLPNVLSGNYHTVVLDAEPECKMGLIEDVREQLRGKELLKVRYNCDFGNGQQKEAPRLLPPTRENAEKKGSTVQEEFKLSKETTHRLLINARGQFRLDDKNIEMEALQPTLVNIIKAQPQTYLILLQNDRATPYGAFVNAQSTIRAAVNEVRDAYTMQHYGKLYSSYELEEEGIEIRNAVPLKIMESDIQGIKVQVK